MLGFGDVYYTDWNRNASHGDKRADGYLIIPSRAFVCEACSGSTSLAPLPPGRYIGSNFRLRTDPKMTLDGVGFSVDLSDIWDPATRRARSALRIHPDGNLPGTEGCIGIRSKVAECQTALQALLPKPGTTISVIVASARDRHLRSVVLSLLGTL
jgi:hypothetical protein